MALLLVPFIAIYNLIASIREAPAPSIEPRISCPTDNLCAYSITERTRFDSDFPKVLGYPSSGGVLMLPLDIAVAEYLNISRLELAHRASNPVDEDLFCFRLRLLGAKWWASEDTYLRKLIFPEDVTEADRAEMVVGWPGSFQEGVWILRLKKRKDYSEEYASSSQESRRDYARLGMCLSMEERCELLERWGATFYEDPREVEEFEGVLGNSSPKPRQPRVDNALHNG